jgi:hypothetical protein
MQVLEQRSAKSSSDCCSKGLTKTEAKHADLLVTYHAARDTEVNASSIDDASYAVSMGPTIELFEREHHQLVWMATATLKLEEKNSQALDQLDKILTKIFDSYPPH